MIKYSICKRLKIPTKINLGILLCILHATSYMYILLHRDGKGWPEKHHWGGGGIDLLVIL